MKKLILLLVLLGIAYVGPAQPPVPFGKWKVVMPPDSLASPDLLRSVQPYLGKKIVLRENKLKLFFRRSGLPPFKERKGKCRGPVYEWEEHDATVFFQRTRQQPVFFDRRDPATLWFLSVECPDSEGEVGAGLYLLDEDLLLLTYLGLNCYLRKN